MYVMMKRRVGAPDKKPLADVGALEHFFRPEGQKRGWIVKAKDTI